MHVLVMQPSTQFVPSVHALPALHSSCLSKHAPPEAAAGSVHLPHSPGSVETIVAAHWQSVTDPLDPEEEEVEPEDDDVKPEDDEDEEVEPPGLPL